VSRNGGITLIETDDGTLVTNPDNYNQASWDFMVRFFEGYVVKPDWEYLLPLLQLVKTIAISERALKFRAGQTVTMLKISTAPYHGLKENDAFVNVTVYEVQNDVAVSFEVTYWKPSRSSTQVWHCSQEELLSTVDSAMAQLWADTK
jgi:hypothetical protein